MRSSAPPVRNAAPASDASWKPGSTPSLSNAASSAVRSGTHVLQMRVPTSGESVDVHNWTGSPDTRVATSVIELAQAMASAMWPGASCARRL